MLEITKIAEEIVNFLLINGLDPPTSVTEYDVIVARKMRKFHRATLSHNNIKCVDLLKLIDPEYVDTNKNQMFGFGGYREKAL
jgi:hypothetical protein